MKRHFFAVALLLITLLPLCLETNLVHAQTGQITLTATQDVYVDNQNPNSNYGGQLYLEVENVTKVGSIIYQYQSIVWLKFNLSSIPAGAIIDTAMLQLYTSIVDETYAVAGCYCSNDSWTELGIKWVNMPTAGLIRVDTQIVETQYQWYNWTVLQAVNFAKTNNNLTALTMAMIEPSNHTSLSWVWFRSKEAGIEFAPKLTIHWSGIVPESPVILLLPFFMITTSLVAVLYKTRKRRLP